jgi:hypothetical protein
MSDNDFGFEKEITLDSEYSIRKDYRSWNLIYKKKLKKIKDPTQDREHYEISYHVSLADLLKVYIDKKGKKAGTFPEALAAILEAEKRVQLLVKNVPNAFSKEFAS